MDRILLAPEPLIRAVLVALCDSDRLHARSIRYLDRLEKLHPPPQAPPAAGTTTNDAPANAQPQPASLKLLGKRKAPEPPPAQICIQCKRAFLPETNTPQACAFHHGRLDIDPTRRTWAAGDGAEHAPQKKSRQDTEDNREDRPEGFLWSCCGRGGAGPGCTEGEHLAIRADDRSKRARYAADPDELRMFEGKVLRANEFVNDYLVDDSSDSEDYEVAWSAGAASREVESQAVDGGGAAADDVPSEATERDSGGGSPRSDVGG